MAKQPILATAFEDYTLDEIGALLNGGTLRLYGGTKPAGPEVYVDNDILAELGFAPIAFAPAVSGTATAYPLAPELNAPAKGNMTWARAVRANGVAVWDATVGLRGGTEPFDITFLSLVVPLNSRVSLDRLTMHSFFQSASASVSPSRSISASPSYSVSRSPSVSPSHSPSVSPSPSA
jgi:hypothetical protein